MEITLNQLTEVMRNLQEEDALKYLGMLNSAMKEFCINTPLRISAFISQLAHESGEFRYFEELASGAAYEGRQDLGNTHMGDGRRYKGRGPIQITGRENYRKAGQALNLDLETNPQQASDPPIGFRIAAWFWQSHGLNEMADNREFKQITRRINGGYTHLAERQAYYHRALAVFGLS